MNFDDVHKNNKMKAFVVAAVAHPYFKVRWLSTSLRKLAEDLCHTEANDKADTSEYFYKASVCTIQTLRLLTLDARLKLPFLNDPSHELEQLRKYPVVARVFVTYNTSVPSSAPVDIRFSQG